MKPQHSRSWVLIRRSVALFAAIGCDAQVTTDYRGEPLQVLHATIDNHLTDSPRVAEIALIWVTDDFATSEIVVDEISLEPDADREVSIAIEARPGRADLLDCTHNGQRFGEGRLGFAWIAVALKGVMREQSVPVSSIRELRLDGKILGFAERNVLLYVEEPLQPDTTSSRLVGGAFLPGSYLMEGEKYLRLASFEQRVAMRLSDPTADMRLPYFPWGECGETAPPAASSQESLEVDLDMTPSSWGQAR